jgi:hypothetical protein
MGTGTQHLVACTGSLRVGPLPTLLLLNAPADALDTQATTGTRSSGYQLSDIERLRYSAHCRPEYHCGRQGFDRVERTSHVPTTP